MIGSVRNALRPHAAPLGIAVLISAIYLLLDLRGGDLAAHLFRAELFKREGLTVWNYNWYGGHHTVSYGVMFPFLSATLGVRLAGTLTYLIVVLLFSDLIRKVWPRGGDAAALVFAVSVSACLVIGQLPFLLGVAFGLGALLASHHRRTVLAAFLAVNCALTSPLAALFVSFVAGVIWLNSRRRSDLAVAVGSLAPAFALSIAFQEGGWQPFHIGSLATALVFTTFFWLMVRDELALPMRRLLRFAVMLYALMMLGSEVIPSPVGGNSIRLGMLVGAPIAAAILWPHRGRYALAVIIPLLAWQAGPAYWAIYTEDKSVRPEFWTPVNAWLDEKDPSRRQLVEVVFTRTHYEAAYVADRRPIARGWERQLDTKHNTLFYDGTFSAVAYQEWLAKTGVRWVALPQGVRLDYSAKEEAELVASSPPFLRLRAKLPNWRIYEVDLPAWATGPSIAVNRDNPREFTIKPPRWGTIQTAVRFQHYWRPSYGCISRSPDGWLMLHINPGEFNAPGEPNSELPYSTVSLGKPTGRDAKAALPEPPTMTISTDFSLTRLFGANERCALPDEPQNPDDEPRRLSS